MSPTHLIMERYFCADGFKVGGGERGPRSRPAAALRPDTSAAAAGPVLHPRILGVFEVGAALLRSSELS